MDGNSDDKFPCKNCITLAVCKAKAGKMIELAREGKSFITMAEMSIIITFQMKQLCPLMMKYIAELEYAEHYNDYEHFRTNYYVFMRD